MPPAKPHHCLTNFRTLIDRVASTCADLLEDDEKNWHARVLAASENAQHLLARLLGEHDSWPRHDRLHGWGIDRPGDALEELSGAGLARLAAPVDVSDWLARLNSTELAMLPGIADASAAQPASRRDMINHAVTTIDGTVLRDYLADHYPLLEACRRDIISIYQVCFFGTLDGDMADFIAADHSRLRYDNYQLAAGARFFTSRRSIDALVGYRGIGELLRTRLGELDSDSLVQLIGCLPAHDGDYRLQREHDRLVVTIGRELERQREWTKALVAYTAAELPPTRERRCRLLHRLCRYDEAGQLRDEIATAPLDQCEADFGARFDARRGRLRARTDRTTHPTPEATTPASSTIDDVAATYRGRGYQVWPLEGRLFDGLFGLAFWDIVFEPLNDALCNPFQRAPLDLFEPTFYRRRRNQLLARLDDIEHNDAWRDRVRCCYRDKVGTANDLVHWPSLPGELAEQALTAMPRMHMTAIFRHLLGDLHNNRNGQPVLFAGRDNEYLLVTSCGHGDRPDRHQQRWLDCFVDAGIPYQLAYIQPLP